MCAHSFLGYFPWASFLAFCFCILLYFFENVPVLELFTVLLLFSLTFSPAVLILLWDAMPTVLFVLILLFLFLEIYIYTVMKD